MICKKKGLYLIHGFVEQEYNEYRKCYIKNNREYTNVSVKVGFGGVKITGSGYA